MCGIAKYSASPPSVVPLIVLPTQHASFVIDSHDAFSTTDHAFVFDLTRSYASIVLVSPALHRLFTMARGAMDPSSRPVLLTHAQRAALTNLVGAPPVIVCNGTLLEVSISCSNWNMRLWVAVLTSPCVVGGAHPKTSAGFNASMIPAA